MKVADLTDTAEIYEAQKRLVESEAEVARLKVAMGKAYHVLEYDGDMRKRALAKATIPFLEKGASATAADSYARASFNYKQDIEQLAQAHKAASEVKFQYEAAKIAVEVARTLSSNERALATL